VAAVLVVVLFALGWTASARASGGTVAVVVPANPDELVAEAATRLRAELASAGFDVTELRAEEGADPDVQAAALSPAPVATIALVAEDGAAAADLWVVDRATRETVVRHVSTPSVTRRRAASVLAVRSVELLRASLIEPGTKPRAEPEKKPESPAGKATTKPPEKNPAPEHAAIGAASVSAGDSGGSATPHDERRLRFGGELGAAALYGPGGISPAFAPLLRFQYGTATWAGRLGLVLPAFGAETNAVGGKAALREELVSLDVTATWPAGGRVALVGSAGAGAYHFHVAGRGDAPNVGHDAERWGFVGELGLGLLVRTGERAGFLLDTGAVLLAPPISIQIAGVTAGRSSQPMLCTSLGFQVAL
jgi:hypothetical protein